MTTNKNTNKGFTTTTKQIVMKKISTDFPGTAAEKEIAEKLINIPAGQFARFSYVTQVPLAARWKNAGYKIICETETTARTGVYYPNIKGVTPSGNGSGNADVYEWVVPNYIKRHKGTGALYAMIAPISKGNNCKKTYRLIEPGKAAMKHLSYEEVLQYTTTSYASRKGNRPPVIQISLENMKIIK